MHTPIEQIKYSPQPYEEGEVKNSMKSLQSWRVNCHSYSLLVNAQDVEGLQIAVVCYQNVWEQQNKSINSGASYLK